MVGGEYVTRNYAAAAMDGRIVQIAFMHGQKATIDLRLLMQKRLIHTGSTLRPRSTAEKVVIADALRSKVWPLLEAGRCKPVVDSVFSLEGSSDLTRRRVLAQQRLDVGEVLPNRDPVALPLVALSATPPYFLIGAIIE